MKVFISYAHQDKTLASKIANALDSLGLDVWDAEREILPGDNWARKIAEGLEESDAMIALITPDGLRSRTVRREIEYVLGEKRFSGRLIPVLVGSPEKFAEESMPWILKRLNIINLPEQGQDEGIERIAHALKQVA